MVHRWRWVTLVALLVLAWTGCSGESSNNQPKPTSSAGKPAAGASGKGGGKGGTAGKGVGATGGTSADGGGSGEPGQGGVGGTVGGAGGTLIGGSSGAGGLTVGGSSGVGGSVSGVGGVGGTTGIPFAWQCPSAAYGDGVCHCGCGASDIDCKHDDIEDCEICNAPNACSGAECPGRISEDDPTHCTATPVEWNCNDRLYADESSCDCGCGAPDPDCEDDSIDSCDACDLPGGCSNSDCPGSIDPDNNALCYIPNGWTCYQSLYGDGFCDCGCSVTDVDCEDETPASCDYCPPSSCTPTGCDDALIETNNAICINAPSAWTCAERLYNDGDQCDCGCGYFDPDCEENDIGACDKCNLEGSCSGLACPGIINEDSIAYCVHPEAPPEWTCYSGYYGDGYTCDCGCGVQDADCRSTDSLDACERCDTCGFYGYCQDTIDPDDTTQCLPAPDGWTCNDDKYSDGYCDCGCGVIDADCGGAMTSNYCSRCPADGCANNRCERIDALDNSKCDFEVPVGWTCGDDVYFDGVCDCGCGAQDADCLNKNRSECDACPEGSCACPTGCTGTTCRPLVQQTDNTQCL